MTENTDNKDTCYYCEKPAQFNQFIPYLAISVCKYHYIQDVSQGGEPMAYSRFGFSDIYIYPSIYGTVTCSGCFLYEAILDFDNDQDLIAHINEHIQAGHNLPDNLLQEILQDDDRYSDIPPPLNMS